MDMQWSSAMHVPVDNLMKKWKGTNGFWIHFFEIWTINLT